MIDRLIKHDAEVFALWTEATRRKHGGDRKSEAIKLNNVQLDPPKPPAGNSREQALRRLNKLELEGNVEAAAAKRA